MKNEIAKVEELLKKLTLEEKASFFIGKNCWQTDEIDKLGLSSVTMSDGPHGIRRMKDLNDMIDFSATVKSICYPSACLSAASFNEQLIYELGEALAKDAKHLGVDMILGPGVNIKRNPCCGRNFEYFSEDPYLSGVIAANDIKGIQDHHVGACIKHFALNNQEKNRFLYSSWCTSKGMHKLYLEAFHIAISMSKPYALMNAYNRVNGIYCSENKYLLKKVLRDDFDFKGMVVTDWGALDDYNLSIKNGLNLVMPGKDKSIVKLILEDIKKGRIKEEELDEAITPTLEFVLKCLENRKYHLDEYELNKNLELCKKIALESMILLKNDNAILPLNEDDDVLFIGRGFKKPRYQGSGSSLINSIYLDNFYDEIKSSGRKFKYCDGYLKDYMSTNDDLISEAVNLAKESNKVVIYLPLADEFESEGYDRKNMRLTSELINLVNKVSEANPHVVIVLASGSPVELPFINKIEGLLLTYLAGSKNGSALKDILYGKVSPSGKLPETWAKSYEDYKTSNNFSSSSLDILYSENEDVGYRYFIKHLEKVLFPFGYGLSYTKFLIDNFKVHEDGVSFDVNNIGEYAAKEVVELYIKNPVDSCKELKGFIKVDLKPHEKKNVTIKFNEFTFEVYDKTSDRLVKGNGKYTIYIGTSSLDILFKEYIDITSGVDFKDDADEKIYFKPTILPNKRHFYTINSTVDDLNKTIVGKILKKVLIKELSKMSDGNLSDNKMIMTSIKEMPLRSLAMQSGGIFTYAQVEGLIKMLNSYGLKGIRLLLKK